MKATKKIVGAACALVAAVALSAGSTFAWFSSTSKATAKGLQVKTIVPTNLYIKEGVHTAAADFTASDIDYKMSTAKELNPVTLVDASGTLTAKVPNEAKGDAAWTTKPGVGSAGEVAADGYKDVGTVTLSAVTGDDIAKYVLSQDMSLMNKAADTTDISLDIEVVLTTPESSTTVNFIKCGFIIAGTSSNTWVHVPFTANAKALDWTGSGTTYSWTSTNALTLSPNVAKTVRFVIWYEGTDGDCTSNNAQTVENMAFSINFTKHSGS